MRASIENGKLFVCLEGRIDSTNAVETQRRIDDALAAHPGCELVLDAGALEYISSAGLRVLQQLLRAQGRLTVQNVSPEIYDIFEMTGFTSLLDVKRKLREISVEGCARCSARWNRWRLERFNERRPGFPAGCAIQRGPGQDIRPHDRTGMDGVRL